LNNRDIPHRTCITKLIVEVFQREYKTMIAEIQNPLERVPYTGNVWSRKKLELYFAITGHYMITALNGHLELQNRLVAF
ncbi:hypothetical protein B0H34DRAFT_647204, partial [Crassisporium funariophilum]